jgi:hypothetical protein
MSSWWARVAVAGASLFLTGTGWAADPVQGELLPPPRSVTPGPAIPVVVFPAPIYEPVSAYEVWQSYGVDRSGRFRPRVIYTPSGFFYYQNGARFPWPTVNAMEFMPYAVD